MLTLIHGDNIQQSRNYYLELKQKYPNSKVLEGEKISLTDLVESIVGDGLFSTTDAVFIELLFSKIKSKTDLETMIEYLNKPTQVEVVLWENKQIDKSKTVKLHQATIKVFSYPQTLFQFLDALRPKNGRQLVDLFQQSLKTEDPELLLFMLTKQIRMMLALQDETADTIDELRRMQPWQKGKLVKQAKLFGLPQLKQMHSKMFEFDLGYKTGGLTMPLASSLDFFLTEV